jgi:hypothetical protein
MKTYFIRKSAQPFNRISGTWDGPGWKNIGSIDVNNFLKQSSDHRPVTRVKAIHDDLSIRLLFKVNDRYVRCTRTVFQSDVWNDSCVEWFVQPGDEKGYFNFEVNCGGTLLASYREGPVKINGVRKRGAPLPADLGAMIRIHHSLPSVVDPEIAGPVEWTVELAIPVSVLERFVGPVGTLSGQRWRANFNKCADECSHPSWATWNPVTEKDFHRPWEFGEIIFD